LVVRPGDIVFNKLRTWQGGLGASAYEGIVSPAYFVCRPSADYDSRFLQYLLLSNTYLQELTRVSKWQPPAQFDIGWEQLRAIPIIAPALHQQHVIANYLDTETARIDALIVKKQRVIELLNEGLNAFVDHEFQHLSARPTRIKYHVVLNPQSVSEGHDAAAIINYLDIGSVGRGFLVEYPEKMTFGDAPSRARRVVRAGDVIVSTVRTYLRAVWMVTSDYADLVVSTGFAVLRPNPELLPEFFGWFCRSSTFVDDVASRSYGVSYPGISASEIVSLAMPLPTQNVQQTIATRLNEKAHNYRTLAQKLARQIVLLRERRQALITAAVTGELKVPGVAA
jgi:type I restriction enzyme S subunit